MRRYDNGLRRGMRGLIPPKCLETQDLIQTLGRITPRCTYPRELESRLVFLKDGDLLRRVYVVDTIDLRRDGNSFRFLLLSAAYFVGEGDLFEPGD